MEVGRPGHRDVPAGRTLALTSLTMLAFAANPLLCRMALGGNHIDPASFTAIRIASGAATLALIMLPRWRAAGRAPVNGYAVAMLFAYMSFFSFAYLTLSVGTGTLILFGAVLLTMFAVGIRAGETFSVWAWGGLVVAALGLAYLVAPGVTAPDPLGALLMAVAGVAWGFYSLSGRVAANPLADTANNFVFAVPPAVGACLIFAGDLRATSTGIGLAIASGALASGLGYAVWYAALAGLTATRAATVQLSVPVIAAFGGVVLLGEPITPRLLISSAAILGGIAVVLARRDPSRASH